jgi:hypothetical protein
MKYSPQLKSIFILTFLSITALFVSCSVGDSTPPGDITDLSSDEITRILNWTAPGDNGYTGRATIYFPRYYSDAQVATILGVPNLDGVPFSEIESAVQDNFKDATQVPDYNQPEPAGSPDSFLTPRLDITGQTSYYYSVITNDEAGNSSQPSNVAELSTPLENIRYVSSEPGSCVGQSVAAGNFNGDQIIQNICTLKQNQTQCSGGQMIGLNDIAVGDPCLGKVYIFYGQSDLTNNGNTVIDVSNADVTIIGNASESFGASLASTTNFQSGNKKSPDALVIGAPDFNNGTGKVYVVFGNTELPSVVNLTDGSTEHVEIEGENPGDNFGFVVRNGTGLLNGRGLFVVGAPFYNSDTGRVYVYKGPKLDKKTVNPATISTTIFTGQQTGGLFGFAIGYLGTFDNDAFGELGVGAPDLGRAYIIFSKGNLKSKDLATDTSDVLIIQGNAGDSFGMSISGNGDIDEDGNGKDDVIVGAPGTDNDTGSVFLYSGEALASNLKDGTTPVVETEFTGLNQGDLFGTSISVFPFLTPELVEKQRTTAIVLEYGISNADFGVGAPGVPNGSVYVFFGQSNFSATVSASDANLTLTGQDGDMDFGSVVEGLEDVNGDGQDDFGVGGSGFMNIYY